MSEFYQSAAAPERRDSGRHGRPSGRRKNRPTGVRTFHLYISVLPAAVMAFLGVFAVADLFVVGTSSSKGRLVLVLLAAAAIVVLGVAVFAADTATRRERRVSAHPATPGQDQAQRRLGELGYLVSRGRQDLQELRDRIAAGDIPAPRTVDSRSAPGDDALARLTHELHNAQAEAWNTVIGTASQRSGPGSAPAQRVEVFVNLARRMQTLSHRAIQGLDELENQVEDPDLLKGLFRVDHLSTRMRRQAESLAVIGGAASRRQWSRPVTVYEVLRSAIAEVEHYNRVKVVPPVQGTLDGTAVADVIHLLAELVENATKFAPPSTQVLLRAEPVTAGLVIEIEDRGLGIPRETQRRLNDLLADIERIDIDELVQDGRIGLLVVAALSRRHHVTVRLQTNLYGGTQAVVVVPKELIGSEEQQEASPRREAPAEPVPALPTPAPAPTPTPAAMSSAPVSSGIPNPPVDHNDPRPAGPSAVGARAGQGARRSATVSPPADTGQRPTDTGQRPTDTGRRPALPRRNAQANLVPELLDAPIDFSEDAGPLHSPGLMAAFQQGMRSAQDEENPADGTGTTG